MVPLGDVGSWHLILSSARVVHAEALSIWICTFREIWKCFLYFEWFWKNSTAAFFLNDFAFFQSLGLLLGAREVGLGCWAEQWGNLLGSGMVLWLVQLAAFWFDSYPCLDACHLYLLVLLFCRAPKISRSRRLHSSILQTIG